MITRSKLRDEVVAALLQKTEAESLGVGDSLPSERELSESLGVSRTVVREALTALEMQGFVELVPGRRPVLVRRFERAFSETLGLAVGTSRQSLLELMEVRWIVETEAAGLAAARATPTDLAAMEEALGQMSRHLDEESGYVDADVAFHESLLLATGNTLLVSMMRPAAGLLSMSRGLTTGKRRHPSHARDEHREIFDCVVGRDVVGARAASEKHMLATIEDLRAAFSVSESPEARAFPLTFSDRQAGTGPVSTDSNRAESSTISANKLETGSTK